MKSINLIIIICAMVISSHCAFSQSYDNNWVFGDSIGLNFSTGEPVFFKTGITQSFEACASISDESGNLLFYTNGQKVWDRNNNQMPNGDDLEIYFTPGYGSTVTQGVLIAPFPGNDSLFYILYLSRIDASNCCLGIEYSIVNMALNDNLGDISEKNTILLMDTLAEKLQLVKHANGRDWWVIALTKGEEEGENIKFVKFLITPSGIEGPSYQEYEDEYHLSNGGLLQSQNVGYLKFSKQGDKVCIAKGTDVDVYDFNRCTGEFFNYINIDTVVSEFDLINLIYGIEFSADGKYIYISTTSSAANSTQPYLYQFCLSCLELVQNTKILIYSSDTGMTLIGLLLGPDNKIYMSSWGPPFPETDSNLYVINNPEAEGLSCNLDSLTVFLGGEILPFWNGLPNMPNYNLGPLQGSECDTLLPIQTAIPDAINIYPNPSIGNIFISGTPNDLYTLTLYNLLGEKVFEQKNAPGNVQINLPLDNGIYEVVLRSADNLVRVEKLIIGK